MEATVADHHVTDDWQIKMDPHVTAILLVFIANIVALYQLNVLLLLILRQGVWFYSCEFSFIVSPDKLLFAGFSLLGLGRHLLILYLVLYRYVCSQSCDSHTDNFIYCLIILITCTVFLWIRISVNGTSFLHKRITGSRIPKKHHLVNVVWGLF